MSGRRVLVVGLLSCLTIASIGGYAQTWPLDAPASVSSNFVFSVDFVLDESTGAVPLGIRSGQTVAQAAVGFCREQGLDEARQTALMPRLVKVLEDEIAEVLGRTLPSSDKPSMPSSAVERKGRDAPRDIPNISKLVDPVLTLGISMDGEDERTLFYFAGQNPMEVAKAFCMENLVTQSPPEVLSRCSDSLSAHIVETLDAGDSTSMRETQSEQRQQQQQQQRQRQQQQQHKQHLPDHRQKHAQSETHGTLPKNTSKTVGEPLMTVPLNINGVETVMDIFRESRAEVLAYELCIRAEFDLEGSSLDSCFSQIVDIVHGATAAFERQEEKDRRQLSQAEPFTFKVPVTLAGLQLHAEFKTNETPRTAAGRFCTPNLPEIESALGLELYDAEDDDRDAESTEVGFFTAEERESLMEACTVVVEDAINAVLLGMRERVLEAELALANVTDSRRDDSPRWPQDGNAAGMSWAASQIAADTMA